MGQTGVTRSPMAHLAWPGFPKVCISPLKTHLYLLADPHPLGMSPMSSTSYEPRGDTARPWKWEMATLVLQEPRRPRAKQRLGSAHEKGEQPRDLKNQQPICMEGPRQKMSNS